MDKNFMASIIEILEENGYHPEDILQIYIPNASFTLVELCLVKRPVKVDVAKRTAGEINIDFVNFVSRCNE